ncbi:hypothetical protein [Halocatena marina]|uniref:hypothetical protein n=1 Tax=Halocatena marina TaxID=2934937 RepID=UPI00200F4CC4|nr:hypothetical protein [Halocatena marina]
MSTTNTRRAILFSQYDWLTGVDIARTSSTSKNATHDCFGAVSRRTGTSVATDRRVRTETPIAEYAAHPTQRLETTTDSVYSVERTQTRTQSSYKAANRCAFEHQQRVVFRPQAARGDSLRRSGSDTAQARAALTTAEGDP